MSNQRDRTFSGEQIEAQKASRPGDASEEAALQNSSMCPWCGHGNDGGMKFCVQCGKPVRCPDCGSEVSERREHCRSCGRRLEDRAVMPANSLTPNTPETGQPASTGPPLESVSLSQVGGSQASVARPDLPALPGLENKRPLREIYFALGQALFAAVKYPQARDAFEQALKEEGPSPDHWEILVYRGRTRQQVSDVTLALQDYLDAIAGAPHWAKTLLPVAHQLLGQKSAQAVRENISGDWPSVLASPQLDRATRADLTLLLARANFYLEAYPQALEWFRQAIDHDPTDARSWEGLGQTLYFINDLPRAYEALQRAAELNSKGSHPERHFEIDRKLVQVLCAMGRYGEALAISSHIPESDDLNTMKLRVVRAEAFLALGRAEESLAESQAASQMGTEASAPYLLQAQALIALDRFPEAVAAADQALQRDPANDYVPLYKSQALIEGQIDIDQGRELLKRYTKRENLNDWIESPSIKAREEDGDLHHFLAQLYYTHDLPDKAGQELERAVELGLSGNLGEPAAPLYRLKGELLEKEGKLAEAANSFYQAGLAYLGRSETQLAKLSLEKARELDPRHALARWGLAEAFRLQTSNSQSDPARFDDIMKSKEIWEEGAKLHRPDANSYWAYNVRGLISDQLALKPGTDRWASIWDAITWIEQAILLNWQDSSSWVNLSMEYRQFARTQNSREAINQAREANSANELDLSTLEGQVLILVDLWQLDDALPLIVERCQRKPDTWGKIVYGYILMLRGDYPNAMLQLNAALQVVPSDLLARDIRATCNMLLGDVDTALRDYQVIWDHFNPSDVENQNRFGWAAYNLGLRDKAIEIFTSLLADRTQNASASRSISFCHLALGNLEEARRIFKQGIELPVTARELHEILDIDLPNLQKRLPTEQKSQAFENLIADLRSLAEARLAKLPEWPSPEAELLAVRAELQKGGQIEGAPWIGVTAGLARLYTKREQWSEAAAAYEQLLQYEDRFHLARLGLARTLKSWIKSQKETGDDAGIKHNQERLVTLIPNAPFDLLLEIAEAFVAADNKEQALSVLREAVKLEDDQHTLTRTVDKMADILIGLGRVPEIAPYYELALQKALTADDTWQQMSIHAKLACLAASQGDLPQTVTHLRAAFRVVNYYPTYLATRLLGLRTLFAQLGSSPQHYHTLVTALRVLADDSSLNELMRRQVQSERWNFIRDAYSTVARPLSRRHSADDASPLPRATPIILEVDSTLYPQTSETAQIQRMQQSDIPQMRQRIQERTGLILPRIRLRSSGELKEGRYSISLFEQRRASGWVLIGRQFCTAAERCRELGLTGTTALNPADKQMGVWLNSDEASTAEQAGLPLVTAYSFMLLHVEALISQNLAEFLGLDDLNQILEAWKDGGDEHVSEERGSLIAAKVQSEEARLGLLRALKGLLREGVPLVDLGAILSALDVADLLQQPDATIEKLRLALRQSLPGNEGGRTLIPLEEEFEVALKKWVWQRDGKTFLAAPAQEAERLRGAVRDRLAKDARTNPALVVNTPGLRLYVRRLLEGQFPSLPVLAASELIGNQALATGPAGNVGA